jgi:hypothetical protein
MRLRVRIPSWLTRLGASAIAFGALAAGAEPLDLADPRARAITVRFENSPADAPDRLGATYTLDIPARFETDPATGLRVVRVAGADVERGYFHRQRLQPGSFSDYVWTFDPDTGHVVSASLSGVFVRRLALGPLHKEVDTRFEANLTTLREAGFEVGRRVLGQLVFPLCEQPAAGCTFVSPARLDARTGYVNAVGSIGATVLGVSAKTFASIGEAIFSEAPRAEAEDYADAR